jgi:xanthine dehydrogenase small subunit
MTQDHIAFILNDRQVRLDDIAAGDTLLDFIRLDRRLTGTKEGCAEGDCGACTVLIGRLHHGELVYETATSCIRLIGSLHATHVVTIEHLSAPGAPLHPVQQAMVDFHGSQCGFCTPGFVMSLYALWLSQPKPTIAAIEKALQGNLCRCTGYEPIIRAAQAMGEKIPASHVDQLTAQRDQVKAQLSGLLTEATITIGKGEPAIFVPGTIDDLAGICADHPQATIVAGATDVGLWVTKHLRDIAPAIFINHLRELHHIEETENAIVLGAAVTYSQAAPLLARLFPAMAGYLDRIGGEQVRNMGTIGGNIANGSPIGDMPPAMIALGATVTLRKGSAERTIDIESFFIDYGKQDRAAGEFITALTLPKLKPGALFALHKLSKRRDEDITSVAGAFHLAIGEDGTVQQARIAFGGMAGTPKRARAVEAALSGHPWSRETIEAAATRIGEDFQPLSDWRASADYRRLVAANLLRRVYFEASGTTARLTRHPALLEEA